MKQEPKPFDIEIIRSFLDYQKESGEFFWKRRPYIRSAVKQGDKAGTVLKDGYVMIRVQRRGYLAHRLAWAFSHGVVPKKILDHINGDRSDNRIENLREVTVSQNTQNQYSPTKRNKTSRFLGVSYNKKSQKFRATINVGGTNSYLGEFSREEDAHQAYINAKRIHHIKQLDEMGKAA